jgi:hypothetical protein
MLQKNERRHQQGMKLFFAVPGEAIRLLMQRAWNGSLSLSRIAKSAADRIARNAQADRSHHIEEARSQSGGEAVRQLRPGGREAAGEQEMTVRKQGAACRLLADFVAKVENWRVIIFPSEDETIRNRRFV